MLYYLVLYARLMIFMFLGIFLANAAMELGLLRYVSKPMEPLMKAAKLPNDAAMIPAIFLFNATAAHAMLASLLNKKQVNEKEAITAVLISSATMRMRTLFQYYFDNVILALILIKMFLGHCDNMIIIQEISLFLFNQSELVTEKSFELVGIHSLCKELENR